MYDVCVAKICYFFFVLGPVLCFCLKQFGLKGGGGEEKKKKNSIKLTYNNIERIIIIIIIVTWYIHLPSTKFIIIIRIIILINHSI